MAGTVVTDMVATLCAASAAHAADITDIGMADMGLADKGTGVAVAQRRVSHVGRGRGVANTFITPH